MFDNIHFTIVGSGKPKDKDRFKIVYPKDNPDNIKIVSKDMEKIGEQ